MKGNMIVNNKSRIFVVVLIAVLICTVVGYATVGQHMKNAGAANENNPASILENQAIQDEDVPLGGQIIGLVSEDAVILHNTANANAITNANENANLGIGNKNSNADAVSPTENVPLVIGDATENKNASKNDADKANGNNGNHGNGNNGNHGNGNGNNDNAGGNNGGDITVPPTTEPTVPTIPAVEPPTTEPTVPTTPAVEPPMSGVPVATETAEWMGTGLNNTSATVQNYFDSIGSSIGSMLDSEGQNGSIVRDELKTQLGIDEITFKVVRTSSANEYMFYMVETDISRLAKGTRVDNIKVYSIDSNGEASFIETTTGWVTEKKVGSDTFNVLNIVDSSKYSHHTLLGWLTDSLDDPDSIPSTYFSSRSNAGLDSCGENFGIPTSNVINSYGIDIADNEVWKIHKYTGSNYDIYIYDGSEGNIQNLANGATVGGITWYNTITGETKHGYITVEKANRDADVKLKAGTFVETPAIVPEMTLMMMAPLEIREEDIVLPEPTDPVEDEVIPTEPLVSTTPETSADPEAASVESETPVMTEATPETPVEPETSADPQATPETSVEPETSADPQATPETSVEPETSAEPQATPETSVEPETSADPQATPETSVEPETSAAPETTSETDSSVVEE